MNKEIRTLLKIRAAALAKESDKKLLTSDSFEIIKFRLAAETYGIDTTFVREVYPLKDFTPLPGVPSFILGIVNVRGQILPIVDLKKFFNLPEKGLGELNKVIILFDKEMEFGILADIVNGTKEISVEEVLPVPSTVIGIGEKYLKGVTKDNIIILSAENLLSDKSIIINDTVTQ
jgi:purine-binding chemotaxis protein CheW